MTEIQSAEEFVKFIDNNYINLGAMTKQTITDLIRARDKATLSRVYAIGFQLGIGSAALNKMCDEVLRELGGEQ